jgi:hypothetical protein
LAGPVVSEHLTYSEGRWAGALQLAPPWQLGGYWLAVVEACVAIYTGRWRSAIGAGNGLVTVGLCDS